MSDFHPGPSESVVQTCDHNCIQCRGGLRHLFRAGWVCVRCHKWSPTILPRLCPDCKLGPDQGPEGDCYWCRESWEEQQHMNEVDRAAYEAGYRAAVEAHGPDGPF